MTEQSITIEQVVDHFAARLERGEHPSIEDYKRQYPHLAKRLEEVLPALVMLENVESQPRERQLAVDDSIPQVLGEYQIIQEIGRGGMGIVFEAQHRTMRRRVALKVLPKSSADKPSYLARFHTEARSAGQLHHTNIAPVFEVGEAEGLHYYSMQFIHGENLDNVIEDIKRIRNQTPSTAHPHPADLSESIAASLITSQKHLTSQKSEPSTDLQPTQPFRAQTKTDPPPQTILPPEELTDSNVLADSVFAATTKTTSIRPGNIYHRRVAQLAIQVAEALDHAHAHNVLHRDVKPANLILDTDGVVWVTDFGLAKTDLEAHTQTGDIIGTLRYMAPERFTGEADKRSDIYSLGLTLYELCTLRTAFANIERANLVNDVSNRMPDPPRKIDENIPHDLETIILKSIEPQPERRYQSAGEMATDLRLFLEDRPIRARRVSAAERLWRVCRRNPTVSTLAAFIVALLFVVAFGSLQFAIYSANQTRAEKELRKNSQQNLFDSRLGEARARRFSNRQGQRFEALNAIQHANLLLNELDLDDQERLARKQQLRNEAIAAMTLPDIRTAWSQPVGGPWGRRVRIALDRDYETYVLGHDDGSFRKFRHRENADDELVQEIDSPGQPSRVVKLSPDGRFLASTHHKENALYRDVVLYVRDLADPSKIVLQTSGVIHFHFGINSDQLIYSTMDDVNVFSLAQQKVIKQFNASFRPRVVMLSDDGNRALVTELGGKRVEIWNLESEPVSEWSAGVEENITAAAWDASHSILVLGTSFGGLYYWRGDLDCEAEFLRAQDAEIRHVYLHPNRDFVATDSIDSSVRLTNLVSGRQLLRMDHRVWLLHTGFQPNGSLCHFNVDNSAFGAWEVSDPLLETYTSDEGYGRDIEFHPVHRRIVARSTTLGLEFWDTRERRLIRRLPVDQFLEFVFSADGSHVFTSTSSDLKKWPLDWQIKDSIQLTVSEPRVLMQSGTKALALSRSGETLFVSSGFALSAIDADDGAVQQEFGYHGGLSTISVSADEKWLVTGTERGKGVTVWDTVTGEQIVTLMKDRFSATGTAHPTDPSALVTTSNGIRWWEFNQWDKPLPQDKTQLEYAMSRFSPDGRFLAVISRNNQLKLMNSESGQELAVLSTPDAGRIVEFRFSADSSRIALGCIDSLRVIDLESVRQELQSMGLAW